MRTPETMKTPLLLAASCALIGVAYSAAADAPFETKAYWEKNCTMCHGVEGKADTKAGKKIGAIDFSDPKNQEKFSDEQMFKTIKEGVKDKSGKFTMKPAENVTDEQIKLLVAHVRTFKK
jgi:cytochrome c551/c552